MSEYKNITIEKLSEIQARYPRRDERADCVDTDGEYISELSQAIYILNQERLRQEHHGEYFAIILDPDDPLSIPPRFHFAVTIDELTNKLRSIVIKNENKRGIIHIGSVDYFVTGTLGL